MRRSIWALAKRAACSVAVSARAPRSSRTSSWACDRRVGLPGPGASWGTGFEAAVFGAAACFALAGDTGRVVFFRGADRRVRRRGRFTRVIAAAPTRALPASAAFSVAQKWIVTPAVTVWSVWLLLHSAS